MNLLASVSSVFFKNGLFTPFTLWLTGAPGSGKTQGALYIGTFYNKPAKRDDSYFHNNFLRANASKNSFLAYLKNRRDNILILDDVKTEDSDSLKQHALTNIDTLIRSTYDHNIDGTPVYSYGIITGEYTPHMNSTLSRILILPLEDFKSQPQNLRSLQAFQENGYLITDFTILFCHWICQKLNDPCYLSSLLKKKENYTRYYFSEENYSGRDSETLTTLNLILYLFEAFCCDQTSLDFQAQIRSISSNGMAYFKKLVKNTAIRQNSFETLYAELLRRLLLKNTIIRSVPEVSYGKHLNFFNYCFGPTENGIYIENPSALWKAQNLKLPYRCNSCLLIQKDVLEALPSMAEDYCVTHHIPVRTLLSQKDIFSLCLDFGFLLVADRYDGTNRVLNYPFIDTNKFCIILKGVYRINLDHPLLTGLNKKLSQRNKKGLSVFSEISDDWFENNPEQFQYYSDATDVNSYHYCAQETRYNLKSMKKQFTDIYRYRFTKKQLSQ